MTTTETLKAHKKWLKKYLLDGYGKRCGHISQNKISLDCIVCKHWLAYEYYSWIVENAEDMDDWRAKEESKKLSVPSMLILPKSKKERKKLFERSLEETKRILRETPPQKKM